MENIYELTYMSRMDDAYALKALFSSQERMIHALTRNAIRAIGEEITMFEDDIEQELMLSIYQAIQLYREDRSCGLLTFLSITTERKLISILRSHQYFEFRKKLRAFSIDRTGLDGQYVSENIETKRPLTHPENYLRYKELEEKAHQVITSLNEKERQVLCCILSNETYEQSANRIGCTKKTYDGRVQRLRKKIKKEIYSN